MQPNSDEKKRFKAFDSLTDICKILIKRKSSDFLTNYVRSVMTQYGNVPKKCPIPAGDYDYLNISLNAFQSIPYGKYLMKDMEVDFTLTYFTREQKKLREVNFYRYLIGVKCFDD